MIKSHTLIVLSVALLISSAIWWINSGSKSRNKKTISATVFEGVNGWGYDILVNDSLFIHQESIPSLPGNRGFAKKTQAAEVAALIINKMKTGRLPTITTFELQQVSALEEIQYGWQGKSE